jgi:hypothetical protein
MLYAGTSYLGLDNPAVNISPDRTAFAASMAALYLACSTNSMPYDTSMLWYRRLIQWQWRLNTHWVLCHAVCADLVRRSLWQDTTCTASDSTSLDDVWEL